MRARFVWLLLTVFVAGFGTACKPPGTGAGACSFTRPAAAAPAVQAVKPKPKPKPTKTRTLNSCTKANSPEWNKYKPYKGSWRTDGAGNFYQWDNLHNDIEKWTKEGGRLKHVGSLDPNDGSLYKGPKHPPQKVP